MLGPQQDTQVRGLSCTSSWRSLCKKAKCLKTLVRHELTWLVNSLLDAWTNSVCDESFPKIYQYFYQNFSGNILRRLRLKDIFPKVFERF